MADDGAERSLTEMRMARAISDDVARRDINTIRELKLLAELGVDQRIDQRIEQRLNEFKANLIREQVELLTEYGRMLEERSNKRFQALSERLDSVGHFVGEWKSSAVYHRGQNVRYNGGLWHCTVPTTNLTPNENEPTWQLRCRGLPDLAEEIRGGASEVSAHFGTSLSEASSHSNGNGHDTQ